MSFKTIADLGDLAGKRAVIRVDLNVPMDGNTVADTTRLDAVKPTVDTVLSASGKCVLLAHFGRPKGQVVESMSLQQVIPALSNALGCPVGFSKLGEVVGGEKVTVLENTRFYPGEEKDDADLAAKFATYGDVYINDAFSAAHRAHASTHAIAKLLPSAAGVTMERELTALENALGQPKRPVAAIVGGAKVSSKLAVLENLVEKVDHLIIGGGMANTFLYAKGFGVGASLCENGLKDTALAILARAEKAGCVVHLPEDVVLAKDFKAHVENRIAPANETADDEMILDAGPACIATLSKVLEKTKTLVWNGPMGAFEMAPFDTATVALAKKAAALTKAGNLLSVAGGGDTVAAMALAGVKDDITHISTAGGAFLEWMEGRDLPGVAALSS